MTRGRKPRAVPVKRPKIGVDTLALLDAIRRHRDTPSHIRKSRDAVVAALARAQARRLGLDVRAILAASRVKVVPPAPLTLSPARSA